MQVTRAWGIGRAFSCASYSSRSACRSGLRSSLVLFRRLTISLERVSSFVRRTALSSTKPTCPTSILALLRRLAQGVYTITTPSFLFPAVQQRARRPSRTAIRQTVGRRQRPRAAPASRVEVAAAGSDVRRVKTWSAESSHLVVTRRATLGRPKMIDVPTKP